MQNFVVYKSSAGSGKTFTLVKEYLRLALFDEKKLSYNYKRILAVTFTNKAAAEMKNRVIGALDSINNAASLPFVGTLLSEELDISPEELKRRSRIVLSHILHHYSDLSIGTIDSFTHKIVKTFAHDLQLPVNFNIETDTGSFYEKVISNLLSQVGDDEYISGLLKEYVLAKAEDNASWDPEKQIQEFSKLLQKENSGNYVDKLNKFDATELEVFRKQFLDFKQYYKSALKTEAVKALELIERNHVSDADFTYKGSGPQNFFRKCVESEVTLENVEKGRVVDAVNTGKWAATDSAKKNLVEQIGPELSVIAETLIAFIRKNYNYYALCDTLGKQMYPLMLLKKIEEISLEKKTEEKLVFISEFNHKIFDMINNEPTPFIYERLGEKYHHYLLDEFQDTSSLQWQNLLPLIDNSLSNGWFNLVVGDGKQSIYRWRNANVKQFASLPKIDNAANSYAIDERGRTLKRNFEEKLLDTNYRSLQTVIEFNNSLFDFLSTKLLSENYNGIYKGHAQKIKNTWQGYVTIDTAKTERAELDLYTCNKTREHILQALSNGFDYKDICILARKNYHGNVLAGYLVENKIPVVSSDSLLLKNNLEVNTLACYLNYLANNEDKVSAAAVINYLFQSEQIGEHQFHKALKDLGFTTLFTVLNSLGITIQQEDLSLNNLLDNCIELINALKLNKHAYHYLRFFLDEINEFLVLKNSNISAFFDWWLIRGEKASMIIPDSTNAVKIMTIHASKGLEFPVVIIPYCNWSVYKINDSWVDVKNDRVQLPVAVISLSEKAKDIGFDQELETEKDEQTLDNLNLLYVAFTRAVEQLHIITTNSITNRQKTVGEWIKEFALSAHAESRSDFFEIGTPQSKQLLHTSESMTAFDLSALEFNTSKNTVKIKAAYLNNTEVTEQARHQGIIMHWILSKIKTGEDLDKALEQAIMEGLVSSKELPELKQKLISLITHPELVTYYRPKILYKLEAELITSNGELLRPDRIAFDGEQVILIDYKTGKENKKKYAEQLLKYQLALTELGYKNIKKLLVYVDEMLVVEVK